MLEVLPNLLEEDSDEPEHEGEAFYNDLFHLKLFLVVSDGPQPEKVAFWRLVKYLLKLYHGER